MAFSLNRARIEQIRSLEKNSPGLLREIATAFVEDAPRQLEAVERAQRSGDREAARRAVHALASMGGVVGADELCAEAHSLEKAFASAGAPAPLSGLRARFQEALGELHGLLAEAE